MIIKGFLSLFFLILVPLAVGCLLMQWKKDYRLSEAFAAGYLGMFALSELLTIPSIYLKLSLRTLTAVYAGIVVFLALAGIWMFFRSPLLQRNIRDIAVWRGKIRAFREHPSEHVFFFLAGILILVQMLTSVLYHRPDADDCFFVAAAVTDVFDNSVFYLDPYTGFPYTSLPPRYVFSPFPDFLAVMSRLCGGFHPAVLAHTGFPVVFMLLAYVVHSLFSKIWFPEASQTSSADPLTDSAAREKQGIYLFFIALLISFSCFSVYNAGMFQMTRIWQGKALLAAAVLPALIYFSIEILLLKKGPLSFLIMSDLACCALSSMGIVLSCIVLGTFGILAVINKNGIRSFFYSIAAMVPSVLIGICYVLFQ